MLSPIQELVDKIPKIKLDNDVSKSGVLEFEVRLHTNSNLLNENITLAKRIITYYKKNNSTIEQSINFIKNVDDNTSNIKFIPFIDGIKQENKYKHYQKKKIINPIIVQGNINYKLSLSIEKPIEEFDIKECNIARIKLRYSISLPQWRLDITLTCSNTLNNSQIIINKKKDLFYKIEIDEFVDKAPWNFIDNVEIEYEYVDDYSKFNLKSLQNINEEIDKIDEFYTIKVNTSDTNDNNINDNNNANDTINKKRYQSTIYNVAKYIKDKPEDFKYKFGLKQLGNAVIELDKNIYLRDVKNHITDYYITDKVDGKRSIIFITCDTIHVINDTLTESKHDYKLKSNEIYILDSEEYHNAYYIFDIMYFGDKKLINEPFNKRLEYFDKFISLFGKSANKLVDKSTDRSDNKSTDNSIIFKTKPFVKLDNNYKDTIKKFKKEKKPYEVDGIIFTPYDGDYTRMKVYKYKPLDKLTIDFLIRKCPDKLLGIKPFIEGDKKLYLLFCGISKNAYYQLDMKVIKYYNELFQLDYKTQPYFPIQFEPSNKRFAYLFWCDDTTIDNNVGEFRYVNDKWELIKIRHDRKIEVERKTYYGNNYKVAELTWLSYDNPLIIEENKTKENETKETTDKPEDNYFQINENLLLKASRNFNSFVKSQTFKEYQHTHNVMDIASGKGQDLFRYGEYEMKNLIFLELDKTALMELTSRKHDYSNGRGHSPMNITFHQMDMYDNYKTNIDILDTLNVNSLSMDIIICNLAFHYFLKTEKSLINVINFIDYFLKPGGRFIFSSFNGEKIVELLNEKQEYKVEHDSNIIYNIKKLYKGDVLMPIGQQIEVLLPFSNEYYTEPLVNIKFISKIFEKHKMTLESEVSFDTFIPKYNKPLSQEDQKYVGLYSYFTFYKKIKK